MDRFVVISGCSGGGKSTLLDELGRRGFATVPEPGRRIVRQGRDGILPWQSMEAFARRAIALSLTDRGDVTHRDGWVFFDRGLIDAAAALEHVTGEPALERHGMAHRYHDTVFMTPPWPEIFVGDAERRHGPDEAIAEYERLLAAYARLGYTIAVVPKAPVSERADFVLAHLDRN